MHFEYTDEQKMLASTVADFAAKESPLDRARKMRDDKIGWSKDLWRQMGELGWLAVPFPESVGGYGGKFIDAAVVLEQLGKTLVPEPYIPSVVLGGQALAIAGTEAQKQELLAPMLAGQMSFAFAAAEAANRYDAAVSKTKAVEKDGGFELSGKKVWVDNGHAADVIFVTAKIGKDLALFAVDRNADGLKTKSLGTIDGRKAAQVSLRGVQVPAGRMIGQPGAATVALVEKLWDFGAAAVCAEGVGVAQKAFDLTLEYLKTREQFDVKIGSFQALQHRAVDMYIENQLIKAASMASMIRVDEADVEERRKAVSAAKFQLSTGGKFVTRQAIQLYGGIGVTDEHDIGLYFKRMHALTMWFGDEAWHEARYAAEPSFLAV